MRYEVEKRGVFSRKEYLKLFSFMKKNADFVKVKKRFQLVYLKRQDLRADRNNMLDLKVRITNGKGEVVIKYGNWLTGETREEYQIALMLEDLPELLKMLSILGKSWGTAVYSETSVFMYKGVEVSLVYVPNNIYYWELEISVRDKPKTIKAEAKVDKMIKQFGLRVIGSVGMENFVNVLNARKFWQFNFTKERVDKWLGTHRRYLDYSRQ